MWKNILALFKNIQFTPSFPGGRDSGVRTEEYSIAHQQPGITFNTKDPGALRRLSTCLTGPTTTTTIMIINIKGGYHAAGM